LAAAKECLAKTRPDAIVLDIMLPDGNGLEFLKELRSSGVSIPVIMLTAWNKNTDIAKGLRAGANDYLGKPFDYEVLLARLAAMFRNMEQVPDKIEKGPLKLDVIATQAFLRGADLLLTQKEFAVLLLFAQHEGRALSAEYLYEKAWGQSMEKDSQALRKTIYNLRRKIENSGWRIQWTRDEGYCFERG
jgi:DNA-binding response OmpR family regulator